MEFAILYSDEAGWALEVIYQSVLRVSKSETVARGYLRRIARKVNSLKVAPGMGVFCRNKELAAMKLRRLVVEKKYLVYYTVDKDTGLIYVVGIVHGARRNPDGYLRKTLRKS